MRRDEASKFAAMHIWAVEAADHDIHEFVRRPLRYDKRHISMHFRRFAWSNAADRRANAQNHAMTKIVRLGKSGGPLLCPLPLGPLEALPAS